MLKPHVFDSIGNNQFKCLDCGIVRVEAAEVSKFIIDGPDFYHEHRLRDFRDIEYGTYDGKGQWSDKYVYSYDVNWSPDGLMSRYWRHIHWDCRNW